LHDSTSHCECYNDQSHLGTLLLYLATFHNVLIVSPMPVLGSLLQSIFISASFLIPMPWPPCASKASHFQIETLGVHSLCVLRQNPPQSIWLGPNKTKSPTHSKAAARAVFCCTANKWSGKSRQA